MVNDVFYSGAPIEVQVNTGTGVDGTLSLASRYSNGSPAGQIYGGSIPEVIFKKTAGIANPVKSGDVTVTVTDHNGLSTP